MPIRVRHINGITNLDVDSSDTIFNIKSKIFNQEGIPTDQQRLIFNGKMLNDHQTLGEYNIGEGSQLEMALRLK